MNSHVGTYGNGYLINWAKSTLRNARSILLELPEKFINATINMLKNI